MSRPPPSRASVYDSPRLLCLLVRLVRVCVYDSRGAFVIALRGGSSGMNSQITQLQDKSPFSTPFTLAYTIALSFCVSMYSGGTPTLGVCVRVYHSPGFCKLPHAAAQPKDSYKS